MTRDLPADVEKIKSDLAADHASAKPSLTIDNLSTDTPPCVKHILTAMPGKSDAVNFNDIQADADDHEVCFPCCTRNARTSFSFTGP